MRKLAIVGTHPDTRQSAPFDDPNFEIWVFNEAPQSDWCKRWDVCFQLHRPEVYRSAHNMVRTDHWQWLQQSHGERIIYMQSVDPAVPNSCAYPLEQVAERWGRRMLTSSAAYALALALLRGYQRIEVYGIELSSNTEYSYQLPGWAYWVGLATGAGVDVVLRSGERQFSAPLYGYEGERQIDRAEYVSDAAELERVHAEDERALMRARSRLADAITERRTERVTDALNAAFQLAADSGRSSGQLAEAERYMTRDDIIPRQEFERRAAAAQSDADTLRAQAYVALGRCEYVYNVWAQTLAPEAAAQLRKLSDAALSLSYDAGAHLGIAAQNLAYMARYDELVQALGGQRAVSAMEDVHG